jgi:hypothetical protein
MDNFDGGRIGVFGFGPAISKTELPHKSRIVSLSLRISVYEYFIKDKIWLRRTNFIEHLLRNYKSTLKKLFMNSLPHQSGAGAGTCSPPRCLPH